MPELFEFIKRYTPAANKLWKDAFTRVLVAVLINALTPSGTGREPNVCKVAVVTIESTVGISKGTERRTTAHRDVRPSSSMKRQRSKAVRIALR